MERWICARRSVTGDPDRLTSVLTHQTLEVLQTATEAPLSPPAGDGSVELRLRAHAGGVTVHKTVRAHVGEVRTRPHWMAVPLRWEADGARLAFPSFEGSVELEVLSGAAVDVTLVGHYRPPFGPVGDLVDVAMLGEVAQGTAQWLVEQIARALIDRTYGDAAPVTRPLGAMCVADVMTRDPLTFAEDLSVRAAASLLLRGRISGAPVVDGEGRVVGVLSERDLLDKAATEPFGILPSAGRAYRHYAALTVGEACTRPARTTEADTLLRDAAREMARADVDRLVVMDGATHVGIITRTDALRALVRDQDDIEAAVHAVLDAADQHELSISIDGGVVTLTGQVELRSQKGTVHDRLAAIDGVLAVRDEGVRWVTDDVVPPVVPMV